MQRFKILDILGINYLYQRVILGGTETASGKQAGLVVVADKDPVPSNFAGQKIVGIAGFSYAFAEDARKIVLKVTHATQTIQVGQGGTAANALLNAAIQIPVDLSDSIVSVGRKSDSEFYALKASGSGTTVYVTQN